MRISPITDEHWPTEISEMRTGFAGSLNVYRTMAHHPPLLSAWSDLRKHLITETSLGPERLEIVVLRVAFRLSSDYEWKHHTLRARACGISDQRISSIRGPLTGMSIEDQWICRAVDELMAGARLWPVTLDKLTAMVGIEAVLDLMATIGFYSTIAFILKTHDTPLEQKIEDELTKNTLLT